MPADYTTPTAAGPLNADPQDGNANVAAYYATKDSMNRTGSAGMVLATVQPGRQLKVSTGGEVFVLQGVTGGINWTGAGAVTVAETGWMLATDALYAKRDGIVTF